MDWLGIGVLLIGIALLVIAFLLIKPLNRLAGVLQSVQQTTDQLPSTVHDITEQATDILHTSNQTIGSVHTQIKEVTPFFQIIGDVGQASRAVTSAALDKSIRLKEETAEASQWTKEKKYQGLYGLITMAYFMAERKKAMKQALPK